MHVSVSPALPAAPSALSRRAWGLVFALVVVAWFAGLDARRLQHPDEGRYAEIAREMAVSGDWVTPRLNDLKYFEKPPLQYWLGAATFDALGVDEWSARLPAALAGLIAVVAVGFAGARLAGPDAGAFAALVLAGSVWHSGLAHLLTLDSVLSFLLAAALCAFLLAQRPALSRAAQRNWMLVAYAAAAGATLTKGLVALLIPGAALVAYTAVTRDGRFVLIDQYRHGLGETSYEIPAGVTEPSDASPLDAAQRELMEETGYGGGQWRLLTTLSANPATQNNLTYCYLATGVEPLGEQRLDPTEDLRVHLLTREEVLELLRTDRIRQALMAAPLWRYFGEGNE